MEPEVRDGALTKDDPRYEEMFSVANETLYAGHGLVDDPYTCFAALRTEGPATAPQSSR